MNALVIIPAYNEQSNILCTLTSIKSAIPDAKVLVVDDGSTDNTRDIALGAGAIVLHCPRNLGYGNALKIGYRYAVEHDFDYILQIDADGQHDPKYLPILLDHLISSGSDIVIGSRFLQGKTYRIPFFRKLGMRLFSTLASYSMGVKITDTTSGYRAMNNRSVTCCLLDDWEYPDANLLIALHQAGLKIAEIPVKMYANQQGKSMHNGLEPIYYVANMFWSIFRMRNRETI